MNIIHFTFSLLQPSIDEPLPLSINHWSLIDDDNDDKDDKDDKASDEKIEVITIAVIVDTRIARAFVVDRFDVHRRMTTTHLERCASVELRTLYSFHSTN